MDEQQRTVNNSPQQEQDSSPAMPSQVDQVTNSVIKDLYGKETRRARRQLVTRRTGRMTLAGLGTVLLGQLLIPERRAAVQEGVMDLLVRVTPQVNVEERLQQQRAHLGDLSEQVRVLERRADRGGFPLGLLLMGAAGYYLWRTPQAREQVMQYGQRLSPTAMETLSRGGSALQEAVQEGVKSVKNGETPLAALQTAAQRIRQGDTGQDHSEGAQNGAPTLPAPETANEDGPSQQTR
ncbi:hypothetical protein Deipe_1337 [Deinococcus peraridilitoris DSM 19664]|uniref:Uncharacterized protein n=2 Tax=Deinococcus TaxID=1298 RepID=K9ZZ64_DEIPD|nr:hypothetical protein Deipe_1337 [Deinococcus peraridilitoris DSM 19664]